MWEGEVGEEEAMLYYDIISSLQTAISNYDMLHPRIIIYY